jgi:hypothetical protein
MEEVFGDILKGLETPLKDKSKKHCRKSDIVEEEIQKVYCGEKKRDNTQETTKAGPSKRIRFTSKQKGKAIDEGTDSIPSDESNDSNPEGWFLNSLLETKWLEGFSEAKIAFCSKISRSLLEKLNFGCLVFLKRSAFMHLFNKGNVAYPRFVRLFYLNMTSCYVEGNLMLRTYVAGKEIVLSHDVLAKILGMPVSFRVETHPDRRDCVKMAKEMFLVDGVLDNKQLTHSSLICEAKILFCILMRCLIPRTSSKELLTDKSLGLMYLLSQGFEIDVPTLILEHMLSCSSKSRKHTLPYANVLTLVFEFFDIPLEKEEKVTEGIGYLEEETPNKLGICQTKDGIWKFYRDLTDIEFQEKAFVKPKMQVLASAVTNPDLQRIHDRLDLMEDNLEILREGQHELSMEFRQFNFGLKEVLKALNIPQRNVFEETTSESESVRQETEASDKAMGEGISGEEMSSPEAEKKDDGAEEADDEATP